MKTYEASWDRSVKGLTIFVLLIILIGITFVSFSIMNGSIASDNTLLPWIGIIIGVLSIVIAYIMRPLRYKVGQSIIIIDRPIGNIEIRKTDIQRVQLLDRSAFGKSIRGFGVGGLFGYMGKFYSKSMGHYTAYVTNRNNLVLIKLKSGKKYLISPDKTDWVNNWLEPNFE